MNTEFTMKGFTKYTDQELEEIELKRINRIGYKTSNFEPYKQPEPTRCLEEEEKELQKEVAEHIEAQGGNHREYWHKWAINTGAGKYNNPEDETSTEDVIDGRIGQRQAIIDYLVDAGIDPDRFNDVSLEDLRKMAIRAGA